MKKSLFAISFLLLFSIAFQAHARSAFFGKSETIVKLQDVDILSRSGESLFLGYKYSKHFFVAGVYLKNEGHVLGVVGDDTKYQFLSPELVERYQHQGSLPTPLPDYQIPPMEYALGYSLWGLIALIVIWIIIGNIYGNFTAERRTRKFQKIFPQIVSCAIVANGEATRDRIALADHWHSKLFGSPLNLDQLHSSLEYAQESVTQLKLYFGALAKSLSADQRQVTLVLFSEILMSGGYGDKERQILADVGLLLKFKKKDIQELLVTFDAQHQAKMAAAAM